MAALQWYDDEVARAHEQQQRALDAQMQDDKNSIASAGITLQQRWLEDVDAAFAVAAHAAAVTEWVSSQLRGQSMVGAPAVPSKLTEVRAAIASVDDISVEDTLGIREYASAGYLQSLRDFAVATLSHAKDTVNAGIQQRCEGFIAAITAAVMEVRVACHLPSHCMHMESPCFDCTVCVPAAVCELL